MDPVTKALFRALSHQLASGHSPEQIARDLDYPKSYVEQLLVRDDFREFFAAELPEVFSTWESVREQEEADQIVQHFLQLKAPHNAKKLQELADSGNLKPSEEARIREILVKMSGAITEEAPVVTHRLSAAHVNAIHEGRDEMDKMERRLKH